MASIDFRGGSLTLDVVAGADHSLTFNFTGFTVTGDTLTVEVFTRAGTSVQTYTLSNTDADTAVLSMADIALDVGTYTYALRSAVADAPLCAGEFRVHAISTPRTGTSSSAAITVGSATATVTVELGAAASLSIGTVTTGVPGSSAAATITGTAPSQVLNLDIPRGDVGPTGSAGAGTTTALWLPGTSGNFVSTPDATPVRLSGDFTIYAWAGLTNYGVAQNFVAKYGTTNSTRDYAFGIFSTNRYILAWGNGAATVSRQSTVSPGLSNLSNPVGLWHAVTMDVDDGSGNHVVRFWQASGPPTSIPAPASFTQIGTAVTTAGAAGLTPSASALAIGSDSPGTASLVTGEVGRAVLANNIGAGGIPGTSFVADYRADAPMGTRYRDIYGNAWTINGSAWSWTVAT